MIDNIVVITWLSLFDNKSINCFLGLTIMLTLNLNDCKCLLTHSWSKLYEAAYKFDKPRQPTTNNKITYLKNNFENKQTAANKETTEALLNQASSNQ